MSFYNVYSKYKNYNFDEFFEKVKEEEIIKVINKPKLDKFDFLTLLSPKAKKYLEQMAQRSKQLSLQHFGKAINLFTPMYIANYCVNTCAYCSYNVANDIVRKKLTLDEIEEEAKAIFSTGLRHILVLTGESRTQSPVSYIRDAVKILRKYFDSVAIEVYPLSVEEYKTLVEAGVDSFTVYQEVYNEEIYDKVHIKGPKKNYKFRLDAPERACKAKMRCVNIGALLGLGDWRKESFFTGIHAEYLQNKYSDIELSISLPRIRPHVGVFEDVSEVSDSSLVQIMLALKIFLPYVGTTISTRESREFRDNLIPLGINKMSAGVSTEVGGHTLNNKGECQFEISDTRNVEEVKEAILAKGYQPLFKNWLELY